MGAELIPADYNEREHMRVKHMLLEMYLTRLMMIVGQGRYTRCCFVDGFAGPWKARRDDLTDSSIGLSLQIMEGVAKSFATRGRNVELRAVFVEKDAESFRELEEFLEARRARGVRVDAIALCGDFVELQGQILAELEPSEFGFFFIDPLGWKDITPVKLAPVLARANAEYLINFMFDFVSRFLSHPDCRMGMIELLGREPEPLAGLSGPERERGILEAYKTNLRAASGAGEDRPRAVSFPVKDSAANRTKYHLVYVTRHHKGVCVFNECSAKTSLAQEQIREVTKVRDAAARKNQGFLDFGATTDHIAGGPVDATVDTFLLKRFTKHPTRCDEEWLADTIEETGWLTEFIQAGFGRLFSTGQLKNLDYAGGRRSKRHVHFEKAGERVQLVGEESNGDE